MLDTVATEQRPRTQIGTTLPVKESILGPPELGQPETTETFRMFRGQSAEPNGTAEDGLLPVDRPLQVPPSVPESENAAPIQIWEGTVQEIMSTEGIMRVALQAKIGEVPDHFADIELEWVAEQDLDLVKPGAVFYLILYKSRSRGGTVKNAQELRFRRLPSWTGRDAIAIETMALHLLAKGKMNVETT